MHAYNAIKIYDINNTCLDDYFKLKNPKPYKLQIYGYNSVWLDSDYEFKNHITEKNKIKMFENLKELHICQNTADSEEIMKIWREMLDKDCVIQNSLNLRIESNFDSMSLIQSDYSFDNFRINVKNKFHSSAWSDIPITKFSLKIDSEKKHKR